MSFPYYIRPEDEDTYQAQKLANKKLGYSRYQCYTAPVFSLPRQVIVDKASACVTNEDCQSPVSWNFVNQDGRMPSIAPGNLCEQDSQTCVRYGSQPNQTACMCQPRINLASMTY